MLRTGALVLLVALSLLACPLPSGPSPEGPPVITRFEVRPFERRPGERAHVVWSVQGARRIALLGLPAGPLEVEADGAHPLTASTSLDLELLAEGRGGSARARARLVVPAPEPVLIERFEVAPRVARPNEVVHVSWICAHATRIAIRLGSGEVLVDHGAASGATTVRATGDLSVELRAEGFLGPKVETRTVRISNVGPIIEHFSLDPPAIAPPEGSTLRFQVRRADSVRVEEIPDQGPTTVLYTGGPGVDFGSLALAADAGSRTLRLVAANSAGTVTESARLLVFPARPPDIVELTVIPADNGPSGDTILRFATRFADEVVLSLPDGASIGLEARGSRVLSIATSGDVTLTARDTRTGLSISRAVPVSVDPDRPWIDVLATPALAALGEDVDVAFSVSRAGAVRFETEAGLPLYTSTTARGRFTLRPTARERVFARAANARGETSRLVPLEIEPPPSILLFDAPEVARVGRRARIRWRTQSATALELTTSTGVLEVAEEDRSVGFLALELPEASFEDVTLTASSRSGRAEVSRQITILPASAGPTEEEPNQDASSADGSYLLAQGLSIAGVLEGSSDRDTFAFEVPRGARARITVDAVEGCDTAVGVGVFEDVLEAGLLEPLAETSGGCGDASATLDARVALARRLVLQLRAPPSGAHVAYTLTGDLEPAVCGDGIVDRFEQCDDGNSIRGDGCDVCRVEGVAEAEPNDVVEAASPLIVGRPLRAFLNDEDIDWFRFTVGARPANALHVALRSAPGGTCPRARITVLHGSDRLAVADARLGCVELDVPAPALSPGDYALTIEPGRGPSLSLRGTYELELTPM